MTRADSSHVIHSIFRIGTSVVAILTVFLVLCLGVFLLLPSPQTMVAAELRSETVTILVDSPEAAAVDLPVVTKSRGKGCDRRIESIRPAIGDIVSYTYELGKDLVVLYSHENPEVGKAPVEELARFTVVGPNSGACTRGKSLRLPIAGAMAVGTPSGTAKKPALPVLEGRLAVYGRTLAVPIVSEAGRLYVAETIPVPPGSQLGNFHEFNASSPSWRGFVDVNLDANDESRRGMLIEATTNAAKIPIYPPVPRPDSDGPDWISLTLVARVKGDPILGAALGSATFGLLILSVSLQLFALLGGNSVVSTGTVEAIVSSEQ